MLTSQTLPSQVDKRPFGAVLRPTIANPSGCLCSGGGLISLAADTAGKAKYVVAYTRLLLYESSSFGPAANFGGEAKRLNPRDSAQPAVLDSVLALALPAAGGTDPFGCGCCRRQL
jgi:hypothetical protein